MSEKYNQLVQSFEKALQRKSDGKFGQSDIDSIYEAASNLFSDHMLNLDRQQIDQIRDKWVKLAEGHIDKSGATKKLQGTSRAEAIRSVLQKLL